MVRTQTNVRCAVAACENSTPGTPKDASFFIVPKDSRRRAWLKAINSTVTKPAKLLVCELHFAPDDLVTNNTRKRIVYGSVPSVNLPPPAPRAPKKLTPPAPGPLTYFPPRAPRAQTNVTPPTPRAPLIISPAPRAPMEQPSVQNEIQLPEVKPELPDDENDPIIDLLTVEDTVVSHKRILGDTEESTYLLNGIPLKRERTDEQEEFTVVIEEVNEFPEPEEVNEFPDPEEVEFPEPEAVTEFSEPEEVNEDPEPLPSTARTSASNSRQSRVLSTPARIQRTQSNPANSTSTNLDLLIKLSKAYLSPELAKFVEVQALLKNEIKDTFESKQFSKEIIFFALKLYHSFPQTYKLMQEYLCLPSLLNIKQQCQNLTWEINSTWEKVVRARFDRASAEQRECVVSVAKMRLHLGLSYDPVRDRMVGLDEIDGVQRPRTARSAIVVYARGIFSKWQQPLSYALVALNTRPDEVWIWLDIIISKLFDVGLNVRAIVTDFNDEFVPTIRPLAGDKTYFQVKDKQIYCFYDCTQLMVKFRDCLMTTNMNFKGMMASWEVIEELYEYDSTRRYKLAPGLTGQHVRPSPSSAGRADLAVQTLSRQVAAALAAAVDLRVLDDSAHGTIQLITTFSTLYEILHSKELAVIGNKMSPEMKYLNEMLMNFERIHYLDNNDIGNAAEPGVLQGFRADVRAAMALQERMRRVGHSSLPLRAFNNDLLRQLFDRARDNSHTPTARQLVDSFRRSFGFHVMKSFSVTEGKLDVFFEMASGVKDVVVDAEEDKRSLGRGLVKPSHYEPLMKARPTPPVARFLLAQSLFAKPCCERGARYCKTVHLQPPLTEFLSVIERKFRSYFSADSLAEGVLGSLLAAAAGDRFPAPCPCFPVLYIKTLYLRFRIANLAKFNNIKYKEHASRYFTMNILHH